jgi:hypothetical protein
MKVRGSLLTPKQKVGQNEVRENTSMKCISMNSHTITYDVSEYLSIEF